MISIKDEKLLKNFGENLRNIRISRELTQEQLAFNADIAISQIGRIERGEINATISTVSALANALELEINDLFNFKKK